MLVLIAGASGKFGNNLVKVGLDKGHQIRGFGRTPSQVDPESRAKLESFIQCESYDDSTALDKAVEGVDAIICAYVGLPKAVLESQLALLHSAERKGVNIFHAISWNSVWKRFGLGDFEHYDAILCFARYVELASHIKPVYVFTGIFGEFAVNTSYGICSIQEDSDGVKTLTHWGDGEHKHDFTYMADAARFSIDLVTTNTSVLDGQGGFFQVHSGAVSAKDFAKIYEKVKGEKVQLKSLGSVRDLENETRMVRKTGDRRRCFAQAHFAAQRFHILGTWKLENPAVVGEKDAVERLFDSQVAIPEYYL